jgi:hypothetical protein
MKKHLLLASLAIVTVLSSCKKSEDDPAPSDNTPSSYNFSDAEYSDEIGRIGMFKSMENRLRKSIPTAASNAITYSGVSVDYTTLNNYFTNTGSPYLDSTRLNSFSYNISSENAAAAVVQDYLDAYATASQAAVFPTVGTTPTPAGTASEGNAGLLKNSSGSYLLLGADGINYAQMIQKVQFGSLFIYQIINRLDAINDIDNTTLVSGKTYTAQEHAWDEAFGYTGFPRYPVDSLTDADPVTGAGWAKTNSSKFLYLANYSRQTDGSTNLHATKTLVTAFIKGRVAIGNKDYTTRDQQINIIKTCLRKLLGAMFLQEYNELTPAKFTDNASRNGLVSEMIGMVVGMKYVPGKTISDAQINELLTKLHHTNVWQVSQVEIDYVRDQVKAIFGIGFKGE